MMVSVDRELVISVLTALGAFEVVKGVVGFVLENNFFRRNLEIREIAGRVLKWSSWLKLEDFEQTLPPKVANQLYVDIFKIEGVDKRLSGDIMRLIKLPRLIESLRETSGNDLENLELIRVHKEMLHNMTDGLNKKCNELRYKPIINWKDILKKIKHLGGFAF